MGNQLPSPKRHARDRQVKNETEIFLPSPEEMEVFIKLLLKWYGDYGRKYPWRSDAATLYQQIVAEILLQRTRADTVASFFPRFILQFPSWQELSTSDQADLRQFLYPLGLWKQKAKAIRELATELVNREGQFPNDYNEIREFPGIGQYIANAIVLFGLGEPRPLLDVNMVRVLERYFGPRKLTDIRDDPYIQTLANKIVILSDNYIDINFAILDLAALICKKSPLCCQCPTRNKCNFWRQNENKNGTADNGITSGSMLLTNRADRSLRTSLPTFQLIILEYIIGNKIAHSIFSASRVLRPSKCI
jgi:A/G-specific adenine glycosylase